MTHYRKTLWFMPILLLLSFTGVGFSVWTFANTSPQQTTATVILPEWHFNTDWTDSDLLNEDAYQSATDFEYALNNPTSEQGKAWTAAWKSKHNGSGGNQYVGSMDRNADDEFAVIFSDNGNYIAVRHDANSYTLYVTYEKLNTPFGTVSPVYKTTYTKNANGEYEPTQSWVGSCNRNIYYITQATTYSFDTESFKPF